MMDLFFQNRHAPEGMEGRIDPLARFAAESDFPRLRAGDERLAGGLEAMVLLSLDSSGTIRIEIK